MPVRFDVGPCLREVVIRTEEGKVRAVAPGPLVSEFTFYDRRRAAAPEWERLTIEGRIEPAPGEDRPGAAAAFRVEIVITPTSIHLGRRRKLADLRVPEPTLRLRPARECAPAR